MVNMIFIQKIYGSAKTMFFFLCTFVVDGVLLSIELCSLEYVFTFLISLRLIICLLILPTKDLFTLKTTNVCYRMEPGSKLTIDLFANRNVGNFPKEEGAPRLSLSRETFGILIKHSLKIRIRMSSL